MNFTEMNEQQCYLLDMYHSSIQYNYALPRSNLYSITQKPAKVRSSSITSQKLKAGLKTKQNQPQTITTYMSTQVTWCLGDTNKYWNKAIKQALYWHTGSSVAGLVWNKTKNSCHCHKSYIRIKEEADHLPSVGTAGNCCGGGNAEALFLLSAWSAKLSKTWERNLHRECWQPDCNM